MNLYHYYDRSIGPFKSLTAVSADEARAVIERIKQIKPSAQCAQRNDKYVQYHFLMGSTVRNVILRFTCRMIA